MMNPDDYGVRQRPSIVPILREVDARDAVKAAVLPDRDPTDLEQIAKWFKFLSYDDMKTWAAGVLGEGKIETAGQLADLVNDWQKRTVGAEQ